MAKTNDEWDEVNTKINSKSWDYKTQKEFIGFYQSKKDEVGAFKSTVYNFTDEKGEGIDVWGTTSLKMVLDNLIASGKLIERTKVKIIYQGKLKNAKTGRSFHSFQVFLAKS